MVSSNLFNFLLLFYHYLRHRLNFKFLQKLEVPILINNEQIYFNPNSSYNMNIDIKSDVAPPAQTKYNKIIEEKANVVPKRCWF